MPNLIQPQTFNGSIGTSAARYAAEPFDSMFLANDSANTVYFSTVGTNGPWLAVSASERWTLDKFCRASGLWLYASGAGSAVRLMVWKQEKDW